MRTLDRFKKTNDVFDIPTKGAYFLLSRSETFLGRAIQGFMRLYQWLRVTKDTDHIPNHGALLINGIVYEALGKGVVRHSEEQACKSGVTYFVVEIIATPKQIRNMEFFCKMQVGEKYRKLDLLRYIGLIMANVWMGKKESLDRDRWTCYSFIASAYTYSVNELVFGEYLNRITPYEFCKKVDTHKKYFK